MTDPYYAETAYDSTRPRSLAPGDNERFGLGTRGLRKHPLGLRGSHCREYLSILPSIDVNDLRDENSDRYQWLLSHPGHEYQMWPSGNNPIIILSLITWISGFLVIVGGIGGVYSGIIAGFDKSWLFVELIFFLFPLSIYLICKLVISKGMVKDKNNIILNRRTGIITVPWLRGKTLEIPFDEFDPYLVCITNPTGSTDFVLHFGHRYSKVWFQLFGGHSDYWYIWLNWEFWQQYMDISQPLPDVPIMEPYRSRDPVTAEYDKKNNRPPDYWKNQDLDTVYKMKSVSMKAADKFPWGATRQQALASGWRPSGYGEGPSTRMPPGMGKPSLIPTYTPGPPPPATPEEMQSAAYIEGRGDFERF